MGNAMRRRFEGSLANLTLRRLSLIIGGCYVLLCIVLTTVNEFAESYPVNNAGRPLPNQLPSFLDSWFRYDAGWYSYIADHGYYFKGAHHQSPVAFFPVYPLLSRLMAPVAGSTSLALYMIAVLAGLLAILLFARWVWFRLQRRSAVVAVSLLMLYPYAFFLYGSMYAESTFLSLTIGAFLALESRWYLLAGLLGAGATACRPVGAAVAVGLVVRMFEMRAERRTGRTGEVKHEGLRVIACRPRFVDLLCSWRGKLSEWLVFVSGLGVVAYMYFLWRAFDTPLAFVEVEGAPGWDQGQGPTTWLKFQLFHRLFTNNPAGFLSLLVQGIMVIGGLVLLRRVFRLFGWGYAAFTFVALFLPLLGTKDFYGSGRYVLIAFPLFAALGDLLARQSRSWVRWGFLAANGTALMFASMLFTRGYPVS